MIDFSQHQLAEGLDKMQQNAADEIAISHSENPIIEVRRQHASHLAHLHRAEI